MITQILKSIADDPSRNNKINILSAHSDNIRLKQVCFLALDPFTTFHIKAIPDYVPQTVPESTRNLTWAMEELSNFSSRTLTGNLAIDHLRHILENISPDDAKVIERIISKDLRCGMSEGTVNKVWPGLIPTFDVCLAHKDISGIVYPAFAQFKMDGGRCHLRYDGKSATAYSRNGKLIDLLGSLDLAASLVMKAGEVWDGELVFFRGGKALDRKTSNGLFNKGVKGTITREEALQAVFICWDIVDFTSTIPYYTRFTNLYDRFFDCDPIKIKLVKTTVVKSEDEAMEFYSDCISAGEEGAILKNKTFVWEPKRVKGMGKIKAVEEADLVVIGVETGTGKNVGKLGALVCSTRDSKLLVNVGTGFSDAEREILDAWVGKIVTVQYNQIITDKKKTTSSLFLPRFIEIRPDRDAANSIDELK